MNDEQKQEIKAQHWYILARRLEEAGRRLKDVKKFDAAARCQKKWEDTMPKRAEVSAEQTK